MKMPKPTEADKEHFRALVRNAAGVEVKPMFGNLGAFVNGNMFAGLFGASVGVKLGADDHAELATLGGGPFGPEARPMGGYLTLPPSPDVRASGALGRPRPGPRRHAAAEAEEVATAGDIHAGRSHVVDRTSVATNGAGRTANQSGYWSR